MSHWNQLCQWNCCSSNMRSLFPDNRLMFSIIEDFKCVFRYTLFAPMSPVWTFERIFGIPDFHYYALAGGIQTILKRIGEGPVRSEGETQRYPPQLILFERWIFWGNSCYLPPLSDTVNMCYYSIHNKGALTYHFLTDHRSFVGPFPQKTIYRELFG